VHLSATRNRNYYEAERIMLEEEVEYFQGRIQRHVRLGME
jgi:hypothetical protein